MKTNILTAIMLALAILVGSCNAPSDNAYTGNGDLRNTTVSPLLHTG